MKQINFFKSKQFKSEFGGELLCGKRKSRRPLNSKKATHLVLMANISNSGSLRRHIKFIDGILIKFANQFGVKIYKKACASNHIHSTIKFEHRLNYIYFIRAVTGVLAKKLKIKWRLRPFTRVLNWGKDFKNTIQYVFQNELEATGIIPYQVRKSRYKHPD